MRLLVLGGGVFVGRAVVAAALDRGWEVTTLTRGRTPLPPGVTSLVGDRTRPAGLTVLADGRWDAVVDTWAGAPRAVRDTARLLAGRVDHYCYVSSRSVYREPWGRGEDAAVVDADPDADTTEYAADKRGGELAALAALGPERTLLARAGLILGPGEDVGRLPWWLLRLHRSRAGGPVLAPGPPTLRLQYVDARDLAAWLLSAVERQLDGAYNVVSEPGHASMGELLAACRAVTGSAAELVWLDPAQVLAAGIAPWTELPIWVPPGPEWAPVHDGDVTKVMAAGLRCRPVQDTVADTWAWVAWVQETGLRPPVRADLPPVGLDPAKEGAALAGRGVAPTA